MTDEQRTAADPAVSAWVSASAGTGKTHVLMSRVLRLLLAGAAPDKLLCLTFTKAAAAEMSNRINGTLARWATLTDSAVDRELTALSAPLTDETRARARRLFAEVLDVPGGLKIQTIHSFCQFLLARFPLEAGVPPHFAVMEERSTAEALKSAVEDMLIRAAGEENGRLARALDRIARRLTENSFDELMMELVRERGALDRLRRTISTEEGVGAALRRALDLSPGDTEEAVFADMLEVSDADGLARVCAAMVDHGSEVEKGRVITLDRWLRAPDQRPALLVDYLKLFLTDKGTIRKILMTKRAARACPDGPEVMALEAERLLGLVGRLKAIEMALNSDAALTTGFTLLGSFKKDKRRRATLDFDDLILETLELLTRPGVAQWVLYKLDNGIDHILIDEAQDTNPEQWEVVRALADEFFTGEGARNLNRTVFAVGDVKQSIYSFQRADPRSFLTLRGHFAERARSADQPFRDVALGLSFRSTDAVLGLVDAVFADDIARAGILEDGVLRHEAHRAGQAGLVELWEPEQPPVVEEVDGWNLPLTASREPDAPAKLALRIADTIGEWLKTGVLLPSTGRPITPGDIMVLVRRRSVFDAQLISALKARNIPVAGADRMIVTEQIAVMDLMSVGRFVLLPEDDLTLATVLRGPLLNLSEDRLFDLAHDRRGQGLWKTLTARRGESTDFAHCHAVLSDWLAMADFVPPFEFFTRILNVADASGRSGRERLIARLGYEANDPVDEFLALSLSFEASHTASLEAFLHWLTAAPAAVKRDMEQGRGEVRIMTVHGAKGLQAPIVFLPDSCQTPASGARLLWVEDPLPPAKRLMCWPGKKDNEVGRAADARTRLEADRDAEYLRLLYVALTRAEDRLYVCGWDTKTKRPEGCWYNLVAAAIERMDGVRSVETPAGPVIRHETLQTAPVAGPDGGESAQESTPDLPAWVRRDPPEEPAPPRPLAPTAPTEDEPAARSPLVGAARKAGERVRFARGNLVHALLERLPELPRAMRADAARRYLGSPVHGLDGDEIDALVSETFAVLEHPEFAPLFAPGSRAEVPVAGVVGVTPVAGFVDRLVVTDDRVMIIDYKTNRPPPAMPDAVPAAYLRQMAAYRQLLADVYPRRDIVCALLWTDSLTLMRLDDASLDRIRFDGAA